MTNEELQKIYVKADMQYDALKDNIHHLVEENKQLKEERKEMLELIKNRNTTKSKKERFISGKSTLDRISEILGDKE